MSKLKYGLEPITPYRWRIPKGTVPGMKVPGEIFASEEMIPRIISDRTPEQVANVATMPGIIGASIAMPDIHWGYGFPIGGVAAFDLDKGVISPGGVGYDINCGVTLLRSDLLAKDVKPVIKELVDALFAAIPCGVGSTGSIKLIGKDLDDVLTQGARWLVHKGMAHPEDPIHMEEGGFLEDANPDLISDRTRQRGRNQLGTLGSGNHFIEVQEVVEILEPDAAKAFGLFAGQAVVMIHSGSRGLGHQVCDESLKIMQRVVRELKISLPDRQLACAPFYSPEGQNYLGAMKSAANFAWANRLAMAGMVRETFLRTFGSSHSKDASQAVDDLGMSVVYDVCHNIAKVERINVNGKSRLACIHRKGATRALGPGDDRIPAAYRSVGQPVIIPGDMGRASYVLVGSRESERLSFSSCCHGAGRLSSRKAAVKRARGRDIPRELRERGVTVRAKSKTTLLEEVPEAYKNVGDVVEAVAGANIAKIVAHLRPIGTIKG